MLLSTGSKAVINPNFSTVISLLYLLYIISSLVVIFFTDLRFEVIPNKVVYPAIVISFFYVVFFQTTYFGQYLLSGLCAFFFFLLLFFITKRKGMGLGDVKLAFLMGLVLGFPGIIIALYVAFLTGAIVASILILWRKKKFRGGTIPFGPFLVFGTLVGLFGGDFLWMKILRLF